MRSMALGMALLLAIGACTDDSAAPGDCTSSLTFTPAEPRLATGDSLELSASASGGCAGASVAWSSSDPATISIDPSRGVAHALRAGAVWLRVRSTPSNTLLDSVEAVAYAPIFNRIIFARSMAPGGGSNWGVWTSDTSGGDLKLVLDGLNYPQNPMVSPDGKSIVFEDWDELFLMDAEGGARRRLDTGVNVALAPSWSPDGKWILFSGAASHNDPWQMYITRLDGTPPRQLTNSVLGGRTGDWSRDGRIAYIRFNAIGLGPIFREAVITDTSGSMEQVVTGGIPDFAGGSPAWAPDGQSILFLDKPYWSITRLTLATMSYDTLQVGVGNREGHWSPDGLRIVYGSGDLWTINADGSNPRILLNDAQTNFEASWSPAGPPVP